MEYGKKDAECTVCKKKPLFTFEETQSSINSIKIVCIHCKIEWTFCMLCDSVGMCAERLNCCRGFQDVVRRLSEKELDELIPDWKNYINSD